MVKGISLFGGLLLAVMAFAANDNNVLDDDVLDANINLYRCWQGCFIFIGFHLIQDDNCMKKADYITPLVFIVAAVQLFISSSATASIELITKLDLDKDGQITIKEAVGDPIILASFGKIDTDGNGKISAIELAKTKVTLTEKKR